LAKQDALEKTHLFLTPLRMELLRQPPRTIATRLVHRALQTIDGLNLLMMIKITLTLQQQNGIPVDTAWTVLTKAHTLAGNVGLHAHR
jgi:hypothetical protein